MQNPTLEDLGIVVGGPLSEVGALAARAEAAGFGHAWVHEAGHDAVVTAAVIATATSRIRIGTDVIVAFARTPTLAAFSAWDLQELSGGRFVLGVGSQVRAIVEEGFAAAFSPPAPRMAEYLQVLEATFRTLGGDPTAFEGAHYGVTRPAPYATPDPGRSPPPVMLAAVGPALTRAAATHAQGILGHPFTTPRFIRERMLPRVEAALADAGRPRAGFLVATGVIIDVDEDREAARQRARRQVAFYGSTPNYADVFAVNGDGDLTQQCRGHLRAHGPDRLHEAIPDEVLERYAIAGTPAEVRGQLETWRGLVDHLVLTPVAMGRPAADLVRATDAVIACVADIPRPVRQG